MHKILVLTIGGSCQPIITSITEHKPDEIVFICSDDDGSNKGSYIKVEGKGKVCKEDQPNILQQAKAENIPHKIYKLISFDDINFCYQNCLRILKKIKNDFPEAELIADYTGGTKSMSVGLGSAAMDVDGTKISIVKGTRVDLIKVMDGTQSTRSISVSYGSLNRQKQLAETLIRQYDYAAASAMLTELNQIPDIPDDFSSELTRMNTLCKAFDAWDRFDHVEAYRLSNEMVKENKLFLNASLQSREQLDKNLHLKNLQGFKPYGLTHGYEMVEDLLLNSERRAYNGRFDDAVARLYRAFELFAQLHLYKGYELDTSNIDIAKLPKDFSEDYEKMRKADDKIEIAAIQTYELLSKLEDSIGSLYQKEKNKIIDQALKPRNHSILAHGFKPITKSEYENVYQLINGFIQNAIKEIIKPQQITAKQFPESF
jgi:CRISPR-associated protein (TIGR02710 family)